MLNGLLAVALQGALAIVPMDRGAAWVYAAEVRWTVPNSNQLRAASIRWETRVIEVFASEGIRAAVVRGLPFQLAWYEPGKQPGFDVLVACSKGLFLVQAKSADDAKEAARRAVAGKLPEEQLLRMPVRVGDCLGGDPDRTDRRYCWSVERRVKERGVSGWELAFRTNPDHMLVRIVPGVGITRFTYEHHGTVSSAKARLVSYSPGRR